MSLERGISFALVAIVSLLFAAVPALAVTDADIELNNCISRGWEFGIARYQWDGSAYTLLAQKDGYSTTVTGTPWDIQWTSEPGADGVFFTDGFTHMFPFQDRTSGSFEFTNPEGVNYVTICGGLTLYAVGHGGSGHGGGFIADQSCDRDASPPTLVTGIVKDNEGAPVAGASVSVMCNGAGPLDTASDADGNYFAVFDSCDCAYGDGVSVTAFKDGQSGSNDVPEWCLGGQDNEDCPIDIALIDVSIPEFGVIAGATALIGGLAGFLIFRKKNA